ncbi:ATP phosphoribosyltransferase regulatory subunit [Inmirania thermothiophila]|uniref:ATP phosphoribosyltransferase regulatory subunit n=1 Tax=Inmirania thermothiophila TaxID=1750597 RepID=A0A3N1XZK2_9GAMM|nr:ATP phosphoribosyltransferase regulatory subunit [Inmirania thermothiophila]ROR32034.1 ATP phosphoribosyltransferase regulatory subunit [Inmirania thermothiophila]
MPRPAPWLLPEGIEELLPDQAERAEALRRRLIDLFHAWGYRLVVPPLVEHLESLLTGTGGDLELDTLKLVDPASGRMLGVRADMTPQVARIEASRIRAEVPTRLCYVGSVLRARPQGAQGGRSPIQAGAELYGHDGVESDAEVACLMVETLRCAGLEGILLDLGHVGIFRALAASVGLAPEDEAELFGLLQRKAQAAIAERLAAWGVAEPERAALAALARLHGGVEVLARAAEVLAPCGEGPMRALVRLEALARRLGARLPAVRLHVDLAELRGYRYHTGVVFAAFVAGCGEEVARGGRYDGVGAAFGRARPATGFSTDLRLLLALGTAAAEAGEGAVLAPAVEDAALAEAVARLRARGERVVQALGLPGETPRAMGCARVLVRRGDAWVAEEVSAPPGEGDDG